ncbi:MATE family efflux transporter, partial [Ideonella sp. A 288]|uniref:MATE family efflux transporter n=1 Tax=Ideonella sp. A 288 TaxID=1962181 RepID=UPI0018FE7508
SPPPTNAALLRQILALAAPTTALSMLQVVAQVVETWLAARQGTAALAGWAVMLPFGLLLQQMSTGAMGGGVVSAVARALGGQRRDEAAALVTHALIIATGFGAVFAIGVTAAAPHLLQAVAGAESARLASPYAAWVFGAGALPAWWGNTLASVLRGGGRHALAARVLALSWGALPVLAWLLAEPAGLGLTGVGIAFAASSWTAAGAMAWLVRRGDAGFMPRWRLQPSRALFARILAVGALASALALVANMTTVLVTAQLRHHGPATVAAYGIAARLEFLVIPVAFGIGSALTALVGRLVGAGDWATARRIAWLGGGAAFVLTGGLGLTVAAFALGFASLFTHDPVIAGIAASALRWTGLAFGGFGLGMAMYFASLGAGRMRWPVVAGLSRLTIAVGGGWWLANVAGLGAEGNFIGVALGITAYGVAAAAGVRPGVWHGRR